MPRRGAVTRRAVPPDPVYGSQLVTSLVSVVMRDGKRSLAQRVVYAALQQAADKSGKSGLEALEEALKNIMPVLEVRPRRVGGATYQVPMEVRPERRQSLGLRWLVGYARERGDHRMMADKLAAEIVDAINGQGSAVKKREDTHRMAEANRAFAHYRW